MDNNNKKTVMRDAPDNQFMDAWNLLWAVFE